MRAQTPLHDPFRQYAQPAHAAVTDVRRAKARGRASRCAERSGAVRLPPLQESVVCAIVYALRGVVVPVRGRPCDSPSRRVVDAILYSRAWRKEAVTAP